MSVLDKGNWVECATDTNQINFKFANTLMPGFNIKYYNTANFFVELDFMIYVQNFLE